MSIEILQVIWFVLVAVLILGFALLSGFDLGIGVIHLLNKDPKERENNFWAVGPFWDSNQVWLLTGGGALFAAFPMVYATAFSAFYLALMLLLLFLIIRAVSIEFRHQLKTPGWEKTWDWGFSIGSIIPSILFGVAVGNILRGIPMDEQHNFTGTFFALLNPYAIQIGLVSIAMFTAHGAAFLGALKEGESREKVKSWGLNADIVLCITFFSATIMSYFESPQLFTNFFNYPVLFVFPLLAITGMLYYPIAILKRKWKWTAFMASSLSIIGILGTFAASIFPNLIPAKTGIANNLTIYNSSSSQLTLTIMLLIAGVGVPLVIFYTAYVYRKFIKSFSY